MKLFAFLLGVITPIISLFLALFISPYLSDAFFSPIASFSSFLEKAFENMPYYIHSLLIFSLAIILSLTFLFFSKYFLKKFN